MLPYGRQQIDRDDIRAVVEVLSGDWLTTGPAIDRFESALTQRVQAKFACALANGTAALHATMNAIGIGPGDEVIVPAITFVATANAVIYQGGRPVFADINPNTLLIDLDDVVRKITPATKAIVAVDYAGQPCDYVGLRAICDRYQLKLIADACHSLGAALQHQPVGSLADLTCFSFHPVKPITSGEGGAVTTNDAEMHQRLRSFRNHGIGLDFRQRERAAAHSYDMSELGFNYRLTDIQAALATSQLSKLDRFRRQREQLAEVYAERCRAQGMWRPLSLCAGTTHAWHLFVIQFQEELSAERDAMFTALRARGIGVNVHYRPVYQHSFYEHRFGPQTGCCPQAEQAYNRILTLPLFPGMVTADVHRVCSALNEASREVLAQGAMKAA
jgi:perosamine synthetase